LYSAGFSPFFSFFLSFSSYPIALSALIFVSFSYLSNGFASLRLQGRAVDQLGRVVQTDVTATRELRANVAPKVKVRACVQYSCGATRIVELKAEILPVQNYRIFGLSFLPKLEVLFLLFVCIRPLIFAFEFIFASYLVPSSFLTALLPPAPPPTHTQPHTPFFFSGEPLPRPCASSCANQECQFVDAASSCDYQRQR